VAEDHWLKAAEEAAYLQKFFVAGPGPHDPVANAEDAKLDTHGHDLQGHLNEMMHAFWLRINDAKNADTAASQRRMRCLLQSPRLKAADRAVWFSKLREMAKKLHDETEDKLQPPAKAADRDAGMLRAKMSLALLVLAGIESEGPKPGLAAPNGQASTAAMEKHLHQLWGVNGLVKTWRETPHDRRGQAIRRLVSPWDSQPADEGFSRPWQTKLREEHLSWLRERYESESREAGPRDRKTDDLRDQEIRDFYHDAVQ
jgi:hypothetical protein